ncbi:MAG: hypothetical protein ACRCVT_03805 [Leadbetterella sp.]
MKKNGIYFLLTLCFWNNSFVLAQSIQVNAENYQQVFEGTGVSAGLYMGHHYSLTTEAAKDQAVRYIAKDLNMRYLQDYIDIYPADDSAYFDRRANYIKACKAYRSDIQVSLVGNKFPKALKVKLPIKERDSTFLNTDDPLIYDKVADWYFKLFDAFKKRGVEVEILNVVNEPDFEKVYFYGLDGNTQKNVALIFEKAVGKFFEMLADPKINVRGIKKPKIMGPSTISPAGCVSYLRYFKTNYPNVWKMIDIVAYHQYIDGTNNARLQEIKTEAEGKLIYQSEMHVNRGDVIGTPNISDELRGCMSLGSLFGNSVRAGASNWFFFQTNYPQVYTPAGLLSIPFNGTEAKLYKHYYAYKQLTSAQPINSHVITTQNTGLSAIDIVAFRKKDTDTVYVHATNVNNAVRTIDLNIKGIQNGFSIQSIQTRTTNASLNDSQGSLEVFSQALPSYQMVLSPFSVTTFKIGIKKETLLSTVQESKEPKITVSENRIVLYTDTQLSLDQLKLYTIRGGEIKTAFVPKGLKTYFSKSLSSGVYILKVKNASKDIYVRKLWVP